MSCIAKVRLLITKQPVFFLLIAGAVWYFLYQSLLPFSEYLVQWFPVEKESHLGKALQFFLYDTPKVLLLLTGIVFVMGMVNSYFTPERTRALLAHRGSVIANTMAAYRDWETDRKSTRLNSSHRSLSRMPSSA